MGKTDNKRKTNALAKHKDGVILPIADDLAKMPIDYADFIFELKIRISQERTKALLAANSALVMMYWEIGTSILAKQRESGWGAKIIDRMSADLKEEFLLELGQGFAFVGRQVHLEFSKEIFKNGEVE